ncbi:acyltransferase [Burkholderia cenocepacia]|uniref:acyltransferase family protein n=1 Tax=Burkholderia cenocepacia TaxID=95486 RepID=UPI002863A223|nr:acyltransferase [Burkholderia cenocepacia]MDR5665747.1 acyltransferase [Burkholderia cenocepacia]MDR5668760.1 acyltransferase [Burkholderia cenocepacia]MDR8096554.1 acyltransferase [Burkholderia cenocepacia]
MSAAPRNARIDLLRGVSILLVLLHHFNIAYPLRDTALARVLGWDTIHAIVRNGNYGVTMFFAISGYLITSNARRRWGSLGALDVRAFYVSRIARIVPCLLLLLALVNGLAAAGVPIFTNHAPQGIAVSYWLVNLASLTFWMNVLIGAYGWVNYALGVLWSLSVEEVFYLSFPLLCIALRRDTRLFAFWLLIAAIGPVYRYTHPGDEGGFLYAYFACFDGIAIGCCTALLAERARWQLLAAAPVQWLVATLMTALYLAWPIAQSHVFGVSAMALGTAVLLIGAHAEHAPAHGRLLAPLRWSGRLSYELYLFHLIVLGALRTFWPPSVTHGDGKLALLVAYLALSAALSAVIARGYATPLDRFIKRIASRPAAHVTDSARV